MSDDFQSGANIEIVVNPYDKQPPVAGRYVVLTEIGAGAMGRVYIADDQRKKGRHVVVKVLNPRMSTDIEDSSGARRFVRAAREAARLDHPSIVPLLAIDTVGENTQKRVAIVQEYESWSTLKAILDKHGSLTVDVVLPIIDGIAAAVDFAHDQEVLHLDIQPGNVFVSPQGDVRVSDFFIRSAMHDEVTPENPIEGAFLAPEQKTGGPLSRATDVYALGLLMQHMLTGDPPDAESTQPLANALDLVVERATREDADIRLPGMEAFRHALKAPTAYRTPVPSGVFVRPEISEPLPVELLPTSHTPWGLWGVLGAGVVVVLVGLCIGAIRLVGIQG
ncbi:MAG: serine/threonine-protein kinase [Myxococcota bacterium]